MALIALLLGAKEVSIPKEDDSFIQKVDYPPYQQPFGIKCSNPGCVSVQESEAKYIKPEFKIVNHQPLTLRCTYCEHGFEPKYVASSDWHEGRVDSKRYHSADSHWVDKIKAKNLIVFDSEKEAEAHGFKPSRYVKAGRQRKKASKEQ